MRKLLFGLLGFATLGLGALSVQPASAHEYHRGYPSFPRPMAHSVVDFRAGPVVVRHEDYRRPHRDYRPHRAYRPHRVVQRCWVQPQRIWNGYRWIRRPVEVCRTVRRPYRAYSRY